MVLGVGLAAGWIVRGAPATAAGEGGRGGGVVKCAAKNGDVNADGTVDLSDAVTILGNLFLGSPVELEPLCEAPELASGLPDTGQNACYGVTEDGGWVEVPSAEAACQGQDAQCTTGCPSEGRFTDNDDGTVTDHCTGLRWQKDTADVDGDGQSKQDYVPWCAALPYCESLSFAGHDDWRLPNVRELQSIVDYGRYLPSIDPVFGAVSSFYWSSTSVAGSPDLAWGVYFNYANVSIGAVEHLGYVRAVRSGP
jgi:hypothetical protein